MVTFAELRTRLTNYEEGRAAREVDKEQHIAISARRPIHSKPFMKSINSSLAPEQNRTQNSLKTETCYGRGIAELLKKEFKKAGSNL